MEWDGRLGVACELMEGVEMTVWMSRDRDQIQMKTLEVRTLLWNAALLYAEPWVGWCLPGGPITSGASRAHCARA